MLGAAELAVPLLPTNICQRWTSWLTLPLLIVVSVWLYTLVFAFSSLWFAHYALATLHRLRQRAAEAPVDVMIDAATP